MQLYNYLYPPGVKYSTKTKEWQRLVDAVNKALPNDVSVHVDTCKKEISATVQRYADNFSEINSESSQKLKELEQAVYSCWLKVCISNIIWAVLATYYTYRKKRMTKLIKKRKKKKN